MIEVKKQLGDRISQGDIYRDVEYIESIEEKEGIIKISKIVFPYAIVLTQDCDLAQDFTFRSDDSKSEDKLILSVLIAPLYNEEHVYTGEHLTEIYRNMEPINKKKTPGNMIRQNNDPRYHHLKFSGDVDIVPSIIDFKHYFSLNVQYLTNIRETNFVCKVKELYREDISQRFASFLSRIGLP